MRKRFKKQSKFKDDAILIQNKIIRIDYQNQVVNDKYKTVFYVPSYLCPEGRMCVKWGQTNFNVGDEVEMKGRFNDGIFLCWSLIIHKRADAGEQK